ncbi:MAG: hypothetical protein MJ147_09315 [Clostridia bacterium]|nr:hypothetical protein [Clostridia bacterium]
MKKFISIFLAVMMIFLIGTTAFAKTQQEYVPIIDIYGFGRTALVKDKGTDSEVSIFMPDVQKLIMPAIGKVVMPLVAYLITGNSKIFAKALLDAAGGIFEPIRFNDDGEPVYDNISLERGPDNFTFRYDWRYDVAETAKKLNEYVQQVKAETGCEKVALMPESMGSAVTMAYLSQFGYDDVHSLILRSSAMEGITLMGELFTRSLNIDTDSVLGFIDGFLQGSTTEKVLLRGVVNTLGRIPVSVLARFLNGFVESERDYVYDECLCDLFGNIPGLWTFVPDEYFEDAKASMLDKDVNAKLIEKIDNYNYNVRANIVPMIEKMKADGVKVAIISHYGLYGVPLVPNDTYQSDFLVDTKFTSIGATCADIGTTLGDGYVQAVADGHNHLSPDGQLDASTCAFPDCTWFVKGMVHTWYNRGYDEFVDWIVNESETPTVYENPKYPQFLYNNVEDRTIDPLTSNHPDPLEGNVFKSLFQKAVNK